jgi:hypothetical protein
MMQTWEMKLRMALGLHFWLYTPMGFAFVMVDYDNDGTLTKQEMRDFVGGAWLDQITDMGIWGFMDTQGGTTERDDNITRADLRAYLNACVMFREYFPEMDGIDQTAQSQKILFMAHRASNPPPHAQPRMNKWKKLGCLLIIMGGAVALHCLFCVKGRGFRAGATEDEPDAKEATKEKIVS